MDAACLLAEKKAMEEQLEIKNSQLQQKHTQLLEEQMKTRESEKTIMQERSEKEKVMLVNDHLKEMKEIEKRLAIFEEKAQAAKERDQFFKEETDRTMKEAREKGELIGQLKAKEDLLKAKEEELKAKEDEIARLKAKEDKLAKLYQAEAESFAASLSMSEQPDIFYETVEELKTKTLELKAKEDEVAKLQQQLEMERRRKEDRSRAEDDAHA
jgi:hypothetical protein